MTGLQTRPALPWFPFFLGTTVLAGLSAVSGISVRLAEGEPFVWVPVLVTAMVQWWFWLAVIPVAAGLNRRIPFSGPTRGRAMGAHAVVGTVSVLAHTVVVVAANRLMYPADAAKSTWGRWIGSFLLSRGWFELAIYGGLLAMILTIESRAALRQRELDQAALEAELARARLHVLQAQLQPHFLFNTLHAIGVLTQADPPKAARMVAALGDLLRASLGAQSAQEIPLHRELALLGHYVEIETTRFPDRLRIDVEVPEELRHLMVPTLVFQPLVENAVRYGVAPREETGRVRIAARREGRVLRLSVWNDGPGLPEPAPGDGVGLGTTRARLTRLYGDAGRLALRSVADGVEAVVELPAHDRAVL